MSDESLTIERVMAAICAGIRESNPALKSVEAWPDIRRRVTLPAVLIELSGFRPGDDPGTGETALVGTFQARIVVDPVVQDAEKRACVMATNIAVLLREQRWGLPVGPAELVQSGPDWIKPELDGYMVWMVEWRQEFNLGESSWPWEDSTETVLYIGIDPDTGPGHEPDYVEVSDELSAG